METGKKEFGVFAWRTLSVHMAAYFIAGICALLFAGYRELFASGSLGLLMRPVDSPLVALGPLLQAVMGIALACILFPFREVFLSGKGGWLRLLLLIGGLSIFAPQVPGPGSFEGLLYTKLSLGDHLSGLPETLLYSALFSVALAGWHRKPRKAWNFIAAAAIALIALTSVLGFLLAGRTA